MYRLRKIEWIPGQALGHPARFYWWPTIKYEDAARQTAFAALDSRFAQDSVALATTVTEAWQAVGLLLDGLNDVDEDGWPNSFDNCPNIYNPDQGDPDDDNVGTLCDNCPTLKNLSQNDEDSDGLGDTCDFCPEEADQECCKGFRGNIDADLSDEINIADLTYLVDYSFKGGMESPSLIEANVDGSPNESIDIADLTHLVNYMFKSGPDPASCP